MRGGKSRNQTSLDGFLGMDLSRCRENDGTIPRWMIADPPALPINVGRAERALLCRTPPPAICLTNPPNCRGRAVTTRPACCSHHAAVTRRISV